MEVGEAIRGRRSVRQYEDRPVPREILEGLVEGSMWAPMGSGFQTIKYVIVTGEKPLRKIRAAAPGIIGYPPAIIVLCDDVVAIEKQLGVWIVNEVSRLGAGMAAQNICLEAYSMGLGSCVAASFNVAAVKKLCHLPDGIVPYLLVSVGYPAEVPPPIPRKVVGSYFFDHYGEEVTNG